MTVSDPEPVAGQPRKPWLAALLTLMVPGLGQLYGSDLKRSVAVYLGYFCGIALFFFSGILKAFGGLVAFVVVFLAFLIWAMWDAASVARRNRGAAPRPFNRWYVYGAVILAQALIGPGLLDFSPVKAFKIVSGSMEPALLVRDRIYADRSHYSSVKPKRGDLVVYSIPEEPGQKVGRVVGLEGEEIEFRDKVAYIDGRLLSDPWAVHTDSTIYPRSPFVSADGAARDNLGRVKIPKGTYFVLGDNRDRSFDSRFFGPVPLSRLEGRLLYVYLSPDRSRIGKSLK